MGPAVILLIAGLIASLVAWLTTGGGRPFPKRLVGPLYLASIAVQTCHFVEEYVGRIYETLPPLFNLSPLPAQKFVVFNLVVSLGAASWVAGAIGAGAAVKLGAHAFSWGISYAYGQAIHDVHHGTWLHQ